MNMQICCNTFSDLDGVVSSLVRYLIDDTYFYVWKRAFDIHTISDENDVNTYRRACAELTACIYEGLVG